MWCCGFHFHAVLPFDLGSGETKRKKLIAALVDLWFADNKTKPIYNCSLCQKNPETAKARRCQEPGFTQLEKRPRTIDDFSLKYEFCPGKATWYEEIAQLFQQCRVALETGILPKAGALEDQDELFTDVFYTFVERWRSRQYTLMRKDTADMAEVFVKSFSG